jgi:hypothetical protein
MVTVSEIFKTEWIVIFLVGLWSIISIIALMLGPKKWTCPCQKDNKIQKVSVVLVT